MYAELTGSAVYCGVIGFGFKAFTAFEDHLEIAKSRTEIPPLHLLTPPPFPTAKPLFATFRSEVFRAVFAQASSVPSFFVSVM